MKNNPVLDTSFLFLTKHPNDPDFSKETHAPFVNIVYLRGIIEQNFKLKMGSGSTVLITV